LALPRSRQRARPAFRAVPFAAAAAVAGLGIVFQPGALAISGAAGANGGAGAPLPSLTLPQLAGQLVIYSYPGLAPPAGLLAKIRAGQAAGVILFKENISGRTQIRNVVQRLQQAAAQSPVKAPLLVMTDQEGGLVRRLDGAPALSEKQIGAAAHRLSAAREAGAGAGRSLGGVGINVNLAPVLDVYRTPGNFIDRFGRSYSGNPRTVAQLGREFIEAQQAAGVAATAKHFPGLGAATRTQNTDERAVTLRVPLASLRATDELPYRSAISAGASLVMVSWAKYPALDTRRPAGLSRAIVHGELRGRLGFEGVTVTDGLEAGALDALGSIPRRALLAAHAGMDLLLCAGRDVNEGKAAADALADALRSGSLDVASTRASVARVTALRSRLGAAG
jgi:beta-N-acetylhexosaminidase